MGQVTIRKSMRAEQWLGGTAELPSGVHLCKPELCWSSGRAYVYFAYADLPSKHWIEVAQRPLPTPDRAEDFSGVLHVTLKDGRQYWRRHYPFAMYSIKSEASVQRNWRPVYYDAADEVQSLALADYALLERWMPAGCDLPSRAEYRIVDGAAGRGFRPLYLSPGDWVLHDVAANGNPDPRVVTDAQLQAMQTT